MSAPLRAACRSVNSVPIMTRGCRCGISGHMHRRTAAQKSSLDTSITSSKTCSSAPGHPTALRCETTLLFILTPTIMLYGYYRCLSVTANCVVVAWACDGTSVMPSVNALQVTAGSADKMVYIWDAATRRMLYKLPGHTGSVNEAVFHPTEPIIGSAASDKQIFLGELAS